MYIKTGTVIVRKNTHTVQPPPGGQASHHNANDYRRKTDWSDAQSERATAT